MKFIFDIQNLPGFVQFVALPQAHETFAYPVAHQFRGGVLLLERLAKLFEQARERLQWMEEQFHDEPQARSDFENGIALVSAGDPLMVLTIKRRALSLSLNGNEFFSQMQDIEGLSKALNKALAAYGKAEAKVA